MISGRVGVRSPCAGSVKCDILREAWVCLTNRASAAATGPLGRYPTFLICEAPVSCMRMLDATLARNAASKAVAGRS
jgi:hypothetical protein